MEIEHLDVTDESGNLTGIKKPHFDVHRSGEWHRTAHVWIINSKKEFLLQKRSKKKMNFPDLWDISAAGHVSAGSNTIETAIKETEEELGIKIAPEDLTHIFSINERATFTARGETFFDNGIQDIFLVIRDLDPERLNLKKDEVESVKWLSYRELRDAYEKNDPSFVPRAKGYIENLISFSLNQALLKEPVI